LVLLERKSTGPGDNGESRKKKKNGKRIPVIIKNGPIANEKKKVPLRGKQGLRKGSNSIETGKERQGQRKQTGTRGDDVTEKVKGK